MAKEDVSRREFLRAVAGCAAGCAAGAVALSAGVTGCSKPEDDGASGANDAVGGARGSANAVSATANADGTLLVAGGGKLQAGAALPFKTPDGESGVVFKTGAGVLSALSAVCTHAGCTVEWQSAGEQLACPCHKSNFESSGAVLGGPARKPLPVFAVRAQGDDAVLTPAPKG